MSLIKELLERLQKMETSCRESSQMIIEEFSKSPQMLKYAETYTQMADAFFDFRENMESKINQAGLEVDMKKTLLERISETEMFADISEEHKNKLAEYLIDTNQGLWDEHEFALFITEKLKQKPMEELLAAFPKSYIQAVGRSVQRTPEENSENNLTLGYEALRNALQDPSQSGKILREQAEIIIKKSPIKALSLVFEGWQQ